VICILQSPSDFRLPVRFKVSYYNTVSYIVDETDLGNEVRNARITVGMIVKIVASRTIDTEREEIAQEDRFARVDGVMKYGDEVWLMLRWLNATGKLHPELYVKEYMLQGGFTGKRYHPISVVDNYDFCNSYNFHQDRTRENIFYLNEFMYNIV
jgi:hypothetical protein